MSKNNKDLSEQIVFFALWGAFAYGAYGIITAFTSSGPGSEFGFLGIPYFAIFMLPLIITKGLSHEHRTGDYSDSRGRKVLDAITWIALAGIAITVMAVLLGVIDFNG